MIKSGRHKMKIQAIIISLLLVAKPSLATEKTTCENMFCAEGQECVEKKTGAECECIDKCGQEYSPVCGSNGTHMSTYDNRCEMLRASCLLEDSEDRSITFVAASTCQKVLQKDNEKTKAIEMDSSKPKPVVCMQNERNKLRNAIIEWITSRVEEEVEHMSYKGLLWKYFNMFDGDGDNKLDTMEFVKLVEKDLTMAEAPFKGSKSNPLIRGLCSSELIAIVDVNSNYKLEFAEFRKCLDPAFHPAHEKCELNGKMYEDGSEVPFKCNTCQCACGHWVCTRLSCNKDNSVRRRL